MQVQNIFLAGTLLLSLMAPTAWSDTTLASAPKISVLKQMDEFSQSLHAPRLDYKQLETSLNNVYIALENLDPKNLDLNEIRRHTNQIIRTSTQFRADLIQKIPEWQAQNVWTDNSEITVRNINRALRYFEDSVGEHSLGLGDSKEKSFNMKTFSGNEPFVITKNGQFFDIKNDFRAGDLILMRGSSEVSAAIARVTDVNTQFSHIAIVTQDPKSGQLFLAESLIEKGLVVSPIQDLIDHRIARAVIYRSEDSQLAAKASEKIWDMAHDGKKYLYDFSMNMEENSKLFCSEVIKVAYETADPKFKIPLFGSGLHPASREFLRGIGVEDKTTKIFAPADIELDHRFSMVAEFRDYSRTSKQRIYDTIFDKVFQWMDEGGSFKKSKILSILAWAGNALSNIGPVKKLAWKIGIPIAPHVTPNILETVLAMALIRRPLQAELQPRIDAYVARYNVVPPPRIMAEWLEEIRDKNTNKAFKILKLGPKKFVLSCLKFY